MFLFPTQPDVTASFARAITPTGMIGGGVRVLPAGSPYLVARAYIWAPDGVAYLEPLGDFEHSALGDLQDHRIAVGQCTQQENPNERRAVLWLQQGVHDLNTLIDPGTQLELKSAGSLNRAGQIVARANLNGDVVAALLTPIDPSPGDISGDCVTDLVDLMVLLESWGTEQSPADYNADGVVNVLDLLFLLANWG